MTRKRIEGVLPDLSVGQNLVGPVKPTAWRGDAGSSNRRVIIVAQDCKATGTWKLPSQSARYPPDVDIDRLHMAWAEGHAGLHLVPVPPNQRRWNQKATFTRAIITGTSTSGPMTAAKAAPELMPNTAMATAMASSKLLLAAVNARVVVLL